MLKTLKNTLLITIFSVLMSQVALACPGKKCDGECPYKKKKDWAELLELEGDKADKVRELQSSFKQERQALKEDHYAKMKALKADQQAALAQVLSPEELEQLESQWHHKKHAWHGQSDKPKQCPHKQGDMSKSE